MLRLEAMLAKKLNLSKITILLLLPFCLTSFGKAPEMVPCKTIRTSENLTLKKCENLNILFLKGTPVERARAHGSLLGKEFTLDNLKLFVALSVRGIPPGSIKFKIIDTIMNGLTWWAGSQAPKEYHEETKAMAEATGVSALQLKRALLLPDLAAYSWALLSRQGKNLVQQGCTSAIFTDDNGRFLQGRNLDFPGSPSYDQNPLLVVHHPEEGSKELKHVSIGTQGLHFSGITGFNEAGITFSVHQNYTRLLSLKGVPMPFVGELVLRSAKNLSEAIKIVQENRPGPLWSFVISDLKTSEAMTIEVSNSHLNIRRKTDKLYAQTNHLGPELKKELTLMEAGTAQNSPFRFKKAVEEMSSWKNPDAAQMAKLLGWQNDRSFFSPVSDVMKFLTIQSVVFEKNAVDSKSKLYVTQDASPAPTGSWLEFEMADFWNMDSSLNLAPKRQDFHHLAAELRLEQKRWTEVYAHEILREYDLVIQKLEPLAKSPDAFLALSAMQIKASRPLDALTTAQTGLKAVNSLTPPLISQGLKWMEIVALWHLEKKDMVLSRALSFSNSNQIIDLELRVQVKKILNSQSPSDSSLSPGFDFFGGYLQGMPSRPTD